MPLKKSIKNMTSTKNSNSKYGGKPGLIITTGDASDFDGFLALPLYYKAAMDKNMDVAFVMNFPAYFGITDKQEKEVSNPVFTNNPYAAKAGLGYMYTYTTWLANELNKKDSGEAFREIKDFFNELPIVFKAKKEEETELKMNAEADSITDDNKWGSDHAMNIMAYITKYIVDSYWTYLGEQYKGTHVPELKFCIGGINSINPFSQNLIKNEYAVYGGLVIKDIAADKKLEFKKVYKLDTDFLKSYNNTEIYMDMNGSMAWFDNATHDAFKGVQLKGAFVMGGVLDSSVVNTMSSVPNVLNRFSCATMNQLYHPENTARFFQYCESDKYKCPVFFISNNEINANFTFINQKGPYPDKILYYDTDLVLTKQGKETGQEQEERINKWKKESGIIKFTMEIEQLRLIPDSSITSVDAKLVKNAFAAFYQYRAGDRKPFDVIPALALVEHIYGRQFKKPYNVCFDSKYGSIILSEEKDKNKIIDNFLKNGLKDKPLYMFEDEINYLKNLKKNRGSLSNTPCFILFTENQGMVHKNAKAYIDDINYILGPSSEPKTNALFQSFSASTFARPLPIWKTGAYNFTGKQIYIFSDIEGSIPKIEAIGVNQNKDVDISYVDKIINRVLSIISGNPLASDEAIIFTGDLIDRGSNSIQLMKNMIKLKETNPNSVILTVGNRDINKCRFADEAYFTINNKLPWLANIDVTLEKFYDDIIINPINPIFLHTIDILKKDLERGPFIFKEVDDGFNRIYNIYKKTMGVTDPLLYVSEIAKLTDKTETDKTKEDRIAKTKALLCLMTMIMSRNWGESLESSNFPQPLKDLSGIYPKYIASCNIMAHFTHDSGNGVVSHSGVPFYENKFVFPVEIGKNPDFSSIDNIMKLNAEYRSFCDLLCTEQTEVSEAMMRNNDLFMTYIKMSANWGKDGDINSDLSPIVSNNSLYLRGPHSLAETLRKLVTPDTSMATIAYNIFGHQPCGYVPQYAYVNNTMHIDLDISKAENAKTSNKESIAILYLKPNAESASFLPDIIGRVKTSREGITYNLIYQKSSDMDMKEDDKNIIIHDINKSSQQYTSVMTEVTRFAIPLTPYTSTGGARRIRKSTR